MIDINQLKILLTEQFPEYTFFTTRRLQGKCIVAKNAKYSGADIFIKKHRIIVESAIPEWKTRLMLGAGAVYKKMTDPEYSIPAKRISEFLNKRFPITTKV
jgi:hypothetical protein